MIKGVNVVMFVSVSVLVFLFNLDVVYRQSLFLQTLSRKASIYLEKC